MSHRFSRRIVVLVLLALLAVALGSGPRGLPGVQAAPMAQASTPTPTATITPTPTGPRAVPTASVSASPGSVTVGQTITVQANTNLGLPRYVLTVIDSSTGVEQSQTNPIVTPARPAPITVSSGGVSWTLTAARPGTVTFRVGVSGEIFDPSCNCFYFTGAGASSAPVTVSGSVTPTNTPTATPTPTPTSTPTPIPTGGLKVQYRAADTNAGDNQIKPHFNIANTGSSSVPLSELTIRYWYTIDGDKAQSFNCDYATVNCGNIAGSFVKLSSARPGADYYLEVRFTGGTLAANSQTGEIQTRFNKSDWTNYSETGDYSFDPTKTAFADWSKVTLYRNGVLVWGQEP